MAGLATGTRPEVLTWERVYTLALIRSRGQQPAHGEQLTVTLDPKALAEQAERLGVADFARFRKEFLAEGTRSGQASGAFRDPAAAMFSLLCRVQEIENARKSIAAHNALFDIVMRWKEEEGSGLSQMDVDLVADVLQQSKHMGANALRKYRDELDELKMNLGLSPHAPVVADRASMHRFRMVFAGTSRWAADPQRDHPKLVRIVLELPLLRDDVLVRLTGGPVLQRLMIEQEQGLLGSVLSAAERAAVTNRAVGDGQAELILRARRRVRHIVETGQEFELAKRRYVLALRLKDQALERLLHRPGERAVQRVVPVKDLLDYGARILESENRLVAIWASFQAERLALCRDLQTFPYDDWPSFYAQLSARPNDVPEHP